jgi:nucleotide-binding universal stress UspA family protein
MKGPVRGMYDKVLFCADLYASSDYAFAAALDIAERSEAELIILHVLESRNRYSGQFITRDGEVWASDEVVEKLRGVLKAYYFSRIEAEDPQNVRIEVRAGIPWVEILRFARKEGVDVIVMAPYTIKDPDRVAAAEKARVGDNVKEVALRARCPVHVATSPKQRLALEGH